MRTERGTTTAETAVLLPALVGVLAVCVWALAVVAATLRCAEAARAAARVAARHEPPSAVAAAARRSAGASASVATTESGGLVTVRVSIRLAPPLPFLRRVVPPLNVAEAATAQVEPAPAPGGEVP
jgi:Flp pilus assembly protein TadG